MERVDLKKYVKWLVIIAIILGFTLIGALKNAFAQTATAAKTISLAYGNGVWTSATPSLSTRALPILIQVGQKSAWGMGVLSAAAMAGYGVNMLYEEVWKYPELFPATKSWLSSLGYGPMPKPSTGYGKDLKTCQPVAGSDFQTAAAATVAQYPSAFVKYFQNDADKLSYLNDVWVSKCYANGPNASGLMQGSFGYYDKRGGVVNNIGECSVKPSLLMMYPVTSTQCPRDYTLSPTALSNINDAWNKDANGTGNQPLLWRKAWEEMEKRADEIAKNGTDSKGDSSTSLTEKTNQLGKNGVGTTFTTDLTNQATAGQPQGTNVTGDMNQNTTNTGDSGGDVTNNTTTNNTTTNNTTNVTNNNAPEDNTVYSPSSAPSAYAGEYDLPTRFTEFLNQMKGTPMISLVTGFGENLPSGGDPIIPINCGQYGNYQINMATWTTVWNVCRAICLILAGWLCIKIVALKSGD